MDNWPASSFSRRFAMLTTVTLVSLCTLGFESEMKTWRGHVESFFAKSFAAGSNCKRMNKKMEDWFLVNEDDAKKATKKFTKALSELKSGDEVAKVDRDLEEMWKDVLSDKDKVDNFSQCMNDNKDIGSHITAFDSLMMNPVIKALTEARKRGGPPTRSSKKSSSKSGEPDTELARVAAETFARTMRLYDAMVNEYAPAGCEKLAKAHDYWYGSYFTMFDQSSFALIGELKKMSTDQRAEIAPILDAIDDNKAAFGTVRLCADDLEGEPKRFLIRQASTLSYVADNVTKAAKK